MSSVGFRPDGLEDVLLDCVCQPRPKSRMGGRAVPTRCRGDVAKGVREAALAGRASLVRGGLFSWQPLGPARQHARGGLLVPVLGVLGGHSYYAFIMVAQLVIA